MKNKSRRCSTGHGTGYLVARPISRPRRIRIHAVPTLKEWAAEAERKRQGHRLLFPWYQVGA